MNNLKLTPFTSAPWRAHNSNVEDYIDIDAGAQRICSISLDTSSILFNPDDPNDTPEREVAERWANARLIESGPKLYDIVKAYIRLGEHPEEFSAEEVDDLLGDAIATTHYIEEAQ